MPVPDLSPLDFIPLIPALVLSVGAILLLMSEVFLVTTTRHYQAILALISSIVAGAFAVSSVGEPAHEIFQGFGVLDPFSSCITAVVCVGLALSVLSAASFLHHRHAERGEFYALMLFAAAGMSLLALSNELITLFVSIEVLSIATYALAGYLRRGPRPSEAGFKYFILGAFSTALLLYGTALLYGATGTTKLSAMAGPLAAAMRSTPMLALVGALMVAAGFAFKVAAVPFHMWTPDVYEGAPAPVTALMSVGVKAAAFAAMIRVFLVITKGVDARLPMLMFATLALLTMVGGNLLAIPQRNVKRMLAYSSIAHAGYVLTGVAALFARGPTEGAILGSSSLISGATAPSHSEALRGILFYLLGYTVTAVGAFATVGALERREDEDRGTAWDLDRFSGLAQRRPGWAVAMAVFMLSLGGIPPTVGFMAKLLIFRSAIDAGLVGLAIVGVLSSAAGVYYYLRVVVYMFMRPGSDSAGEPERHWSTDVGLWAATLSVMALGLLPNLVSGWLGHASMIFGAP